MNISNYYWFFQSAIPPRICDDIVKYGIASKENEVQALTGGFGRDRDLSKNPLTKKEVADLKKKKADAEKSALEEDHMDHEGRMAKSQMYKMKT